MFWTDADFTMISQTQEAKYSKVQLACKFSVTVVLLILFFQKNIIYVYNHCGLSNRGIICHIAQYYSTHYSLNFGSSYPYNKLTRRVMFKFYRPRIIHAGNVDITADVIWSDYSTIQLAFEIKRVITTDPLIFLQVLCADCNTLYYYDHWSDYAQNT